MLIAVILLPIKILRQVSSHFVWHTVRNSGGEILRSLHVGSKEFLEEHTLFPRVMHSFSLGFRRHARGEEVVVGLKGWSDSVGDGFELGDNRMRRAGKRLDAGGETFGLLTVAADRYAKEFEKLAM